MTHKDVLQRSVREHNAGNGESGRGCRGGGKYQVLRYQTAKKNTIPMSSAQSFRSCFRSLHEDVVRDLQGLRGGAGQIVDVFTVKKKLGR